MLNQLDFFGSTESTPFQDLPLAHPVEISSVNSLSELKRLVRRWQSHPPTLVGLDVETAGLSPLRGAKIRTIQLQVDGEPSCWVLDVWSIGPEWAATLAPVFRSESTTWVAHNAAFEVEHLAAAGIRMLSPIRCTLTAAQLLSKGILPTPLNGLDLVSCCGRLLKVQVYKEQQISNWDRAILTQEQAYAALDAWLTLELWKEQLPRLKKARMEKVHQVESQVLPAVAEARLTGIRLDKDKTSELSLQWGKKREKLNQIAYRLEKELKVDYINSNQQLAAISERPFYLQNIFVPRVIEIIDGAAGQKVANTYLYNWVALARLDQEQRIRPQLKSLGAITGRMSCPQGDLFPSTLHGVPVGSELRELFIAAPGHLLVDGDWSAIEHRLAAAIYGEQAYVNIYNSDDPDPHSHTATSIFCRKITKADKEERVVGKMANFCLQYGGGPKRLQEQLAEGFNREVSIDEARKICQGWDKAYPAIARIRDRIRKNEPWEVISPLGRRMAGHRIVTHPTGSGFSKAVPERLKSTAALALLIQSATAELLKETLIMLMPRLWLELPGVKLCHLIHDEILLEAPEHLAQSAADLLLEVMQDSRLQQFYLKDVLPLVAEVRIGRTWAGTSNYNELRIFEDDK